MTDSIDDDYDEAMKLFDGKPIPKIGEPTEYIVTDQNMAPTLSEEYQKALIEKYGHIPELNHMVPVDEDEDYAVPTKYIPAPEDDSGW